MSSEARVHAWIERGLSRTDAVLRVKADLVSEAQSMLDDKNFMGLVVNVSPAFEGIRLPPRDYYCSRTSDPEVLASALSIDGEDGHTVIPVYRRPG